MTIYTMEEEKRAANTGGRGIIDYMPEYEVSGSLFRRAIGKPMVTPGTKFLQK
jgi:hypothetical protein